MAGLPLRPDKFFYYKIWWTSTSVVTLPIALVWRRIIWEHEQIGKKNLAPIEQKTFSATVLSLPYPFISFLPIFIEN